VAVEVAGGDFTEGDLRLDDKLPGVYRRHDLLLARLRFTHVDFVAEPKWNLALLAHDSFAGELREVGPDEVERPLHVGPDLNLWILEALVWHSILAPVENALDYTDTWHTSGAVVTRRHEVSSGMNFPR
jgi:hypothetical protein